MWAWPRQFFKDDIGIKEMLLFPWHDVTEMQLDFIPLQSQVRSPLQFPGTQKLSQPLHLPIHHAAHWPHVINFCSEVFECGVICHKSLKGSNLYLFSLFLLITGCSGQWEWAGPDHGEAHTTMIMKEKINKIKPDGIRVSG